VSWRVIPTRRSQPDYDRLSDDDRLQLHLDLFSWVDDGPPRGSRRSLLGAEVFEDVSDSGFVITYFASEAERYVAVLRVRRGS